MSPELPNIRSIFDAAAELPPGAQRTAYLANACPGMPDVRQRVEALLKAYDDAGSFLEPPASNAAQTVRIPDRAETSGTRIGPYKLLQQIGEGGMGTVYMAEQVEPVARRVALKIIKPGMDSRQVIVRFEAERQALALMDHPNIAKMLDAGTTSEGRPYFVMELVKGVSVIQYCDDNRLEIADRLKLFVSICQAVQHAHQKGVIHRDIKPTNVLVADYDNRPMVKIIDFGVAKAVSQPLVDRTMFTEFGQIVGTIEYMSPEQAKLNQLDIDTRTDIYSLGVLLYELLTGSTPLDRGRLRDAAFDEVLRVIREEEPPKPSTRLSTSATLPSIATNRHTEPARLSRSVRGDLDWIVMKCLEKERARRYETASELAADLERHLDHQPVLAVKPTFSYRASKYVIRNKLPVVAAAIVCLAVVGGALLSAIGFVRAVSAERVVRQQRDDVTSERDHAVRAEATAEEQRQKAEVEARRAQLQVADSLISEGDALTTAAEYRSAYARFADAEAKLESLGAPLTRLDFSLVRLYRASPPPLWSASAKGDAPWQYVVLNARQELLVYDKKTACHVLDLVTGAWTRSFNIRGPVSRMAAVDTATGPLVALGNMDAVRFIDPVSGGELRHADDDRAMKGCVFSPDGALAASVNQSGEVVFWETGTLKIIGKGRHGKSIFDLTFSHDGKLVATVCEENTVMLWDPHTAAQVRTIDESPNRGKDAKGCTCVAFSADDKTIFCGEFLGNVVALSVEGPLLYVHGPLRAAINSVVASTDSDRILVATRDGTVEAFEPSSTTPSQTLANPGSEAVTLVYVGKGSPNKLVAKTAASSPDSEIAVVVDSSGHFTAWPLVAPRRGTGRLRGGMSVSRDGLLVTGIVRNPGEHYDREVRDFATGRTLRTIEQSAYPNASCFGSDSTRLYTGEDDGTLAAFDLQHDRCDWVVHAHDGGQIWSIDVSADGTLVASGGNDGAARVWSTDSGKLMAAVGGQSDEVRQVLFAPGESKANLPGETTTLEGHNIFIGAATSAFVSEWQPQSDKQPHRVSLPGYVKALTTSPDGKLLAAGLNHGGIQLLGIDPCAPIAFLGPVGNAVNGFCFIDTGNAAESWAVSAGIEELRVWDVAARKEKLVLDTGTQYGVNTLVANPERTKIIAANCGTIDFRLPEKIRTLAQSPSLHSRAELYAAFGLWNWVEAIVTRSLNEREGHPAILQARAHWMTGDTTAARQAFDLAVARQEVPAWYPELCLSAETPSRKIAQSPPKSRPDDPSRKHAHKTLPAGVTSASDFKTLKAAIGREVVVEGDVHTSSWSNTGNVLNIFFEGDGPRSPALLAIVFKDQRAKFDAAFHGDAAGAFAGAHLHIKGKVVRYGGQSSRYTGWPQIILDDPAQVTIVP